MVVTLGNPVDEVTDFIVEVGFEFPAGQISYGGWLDEFGSVLDVG